MAMLFLKSFSFYNVANAINSAYSPGLPQSRSFADSFASQTSPCLFRRRRSERVKGNAVDHSFIRTPTTTRHYDCAERILHNLGGWDDFLVAARAIIRTKVGQCKKSKDPECMNNLDGLLIKEKGLVELFLHVLPNVINDPIWVQERLEEAESLQIGFVKLNILEAEGIHLRLHLFDPEMAKQAAAEVDGIHTHKWDFQSAVLYGELHSEIYELCDASADGAEKKLEIVKVVGQDGKQDRVWTGEEPYVCKVRNDKHVAGKTYFFETSQIHRVIPNPNDLPTATLMLSHRASEQAKEYKKREEHEAAQGKMVDATNEKVPADTFHRLMQQLRENLVEDQVLSETSQRYSHRHFLNTEDILLLVEERELPYEERRMFSDTQQPFLQSPAPDKSQVNASESSGCICSACNVM